MQSIKIQNFEQNNGSKKFPCFRSLSSSESHKILLNLLNRLKIEETKDTTNLVESIVKRGLLAEGWNLETNPEKFSDLFNCFNLKKSNMVWLNWGHFDCLDELSTGDLIEFFDDIWYPSSDDLDILDQNYQWLISVDHMGLVSILVI